MVTIRFHGDIGKNIKKDVYSLDVKSVSEAIHAVNTLNNNKLYKYLGQNQDKPYKILINGEVFESKAPLLQPTEESVHQIRNSKLCLKSSKIKTIDIVPVLTFHDSDILQIIVGALLIVAGIVVTGLTFGGAGIIGGGLIVAGIGLIASGALGLLSKPPDFEDFREISTGGKQSYLFNGPTNVIGEGGPVPVGYGRLIVGSQVIAASYDIYNSPIANVDYGDNPTDLLFSINCGSLTVAEQFQQDPKWSNAYSIGGILNTALAIDTTGLTDPAPDIVYQSAITKNVNSTDYIVYEFAFGLSYVNKPIRYRFHFAELVETMPVGGRVFDLILNGQTVGNDLDIRNLAGAVRKGYILEGTSTIGGDGVIRIETDNFSGSVADASILNGFEIFAND